MSIESSANNKRIAKNTSLLYFHMILVILTSMFVSSEVHVSLGIKVISKKTSLKNEGIFISLRRYLQVPMKVPS